MSWFGKLKALHGIVDRLTERVNRLDESLWEHWHARVTKLQVQRMENDLEALNERLDRQAAVIQDLHDRTMVKTKERDYRTLGQFQVPVNKAVEALMEHDNYELAYYPRDRVVAQAKSDEETE